MREDEKFCPKCSKRMEHGVTIDTTHGAYTQAQWHPGQPKYSWWTGLKASKKMMMPITTYRCPKCGFLESYANLNPSS